MKYFSLLLLSACLLPGQINSQHLQTPCTLQTRANTGYCLDIECVPFFGYVNGGTPPYQFQWSNGGTTKDISLHYDANIVNWDTCMTLTVTDAAGCIAIAAARYIYGHPPQFPMDSTFLSNDSITVSPAGGNFDLSNNDHVFAQNYMVVQPVKHGNLTLNADGTGVYTADPDWCGPDFFRYTATDTSGCVYGPMTTVWIEQSPCAGILPEKTDCNQDCNGAAFFYQNGVLTPPLSYNWSNGSSDVLAEQLCEGPVSVTVTDALGLVQTYTASIGASELQASISGPQLVCSGTVVTLSANITTLNNPDYQFYWSGTGIYNNNSQFNNPTSANSYSSTGAANYQLHVRSAEGCEITADWTIALLPALSVNLSVEKPQCPGDSLEMRTSISSPGTPPYFYNWSGPNGVQSNYADLIWPDFTSAYNGLYAVTVTDLNGCSSVPMYQLTVPDTCGYSATIFDKGIIYCSGSDMRLRFGMSPTWVLPEKIEWSGPNGFYSNDLRPVLSNIQTNMTGWYYLSIQMGSTVITDSAFYTITPDALYFTDISITPPTECFSPYDGVFSLEMSAPPPYSVKYSDGGAYQTVNSNPIVRYNARTDFTDVSVKKNGCVAFKTLFVETPEPPQILVQTESCAGNDAAITISSVNPLSFAWKLPGSYSFSNSQQNLIGIAPGVYILSAKDLTTNCTFRDTFELLPYLDFNIAVVDTPTCTSSDGSLLAIPSGNLPPPISYDWNTGFSGNPIAGLAPGGYSLTLTDDDGCYRHKNTVLAPEEACIAQVSGHIYANTACNCTADNNTVIFPFAKICATNGSQTTCTFADNTGAYTLGLTEPGAYTITATTYLPSAQGACTELNYQLGQDITKDTTGVDFFFCATPESDLQVVINCAAARPGFEYNSVVQVRNNGAWTADTSLLTVQLSPYISNPMFSPQPESYNPATGTATWRIAKLAIYQLFKINIIGTVNAALGDTLTMEAEVKSLYTPDSYTANNKSTCSAIVAGAFDPNDKLVNPIGVGASGNISPADTVLTYTIRFQNTGTDFAFTVVVRDTLDTTVFDLNSISPLFASHPYRLDVEAGHILVFTFDPIHLPDSNRTVEGSMGFVMFSIRLKNDLPEGSRISNSAAIYFDYNSPVITNTAQNTIVALNSQVPPCLGITLMPNPSSGRTFLFIEQTAGLKWVDISLFSFDGVLSKHLNYSQAPLPGFTIPIDTHMLPSGMYIVSVRTNLGMVSKKLLVIAE